MNMDKEEKQKKKAYMARQYGLLHSKLSKKYGVPRALVHRIRTTKLPKETFIAILELKMARIQREIELNLDALAKRREEAQALRGVDPADYETVQTEPMILK